MDLLQSLIRPFRYPSQNDTPANSFSDNGSGESHASLAHVQQDNHTSIDVQNAHISANALRDLGAQTLAEWEASRALETASAPASHDASLPSSPVHTSQSSYLIASSAGSSAAAIPTVTPTGAPRTTEYIQKLYQLCQVRGLVPEFTFKQTGQRWVVRMTVAGHEVLAAGSYASKMEGKEVCAMRGVEIVEGIAVRGDIVGEATTGELGSAGGGLKKLQEENWVGLLLEFSNANSHTQPIYQDYIHGTQAFATTVRLPSLSASPLFGKTSTLYNSKKAAKAAASMEAVAWLRTNGMMPDEGGPLRKKARRSEGSLVGIGGFENGNGHGNGGKEGITAGKNTTTTTTTTTAATAILRTTSSTSESPTGETPEPDVPASKEVVDLCEMLGLSLPTYKLEQQASTSLYSGAAYFENDVFFFVEGSKLKGPVGEVRNVFGRKRAKEEVARGVVKVLRGVVEERLAGV